jgi:hypothetical protein
MQKKLKMITKTKNSIKISRDEWEKMRKNPAFSEAVELIEDMADLKSAKSQKGKDISLKQYLKKRDLRNNP